MKKNYHFVKQHRESLLIAAWGLLCFSLSIVRCAYTHDRLFLFLNWNLFLAFVPWVISKSAVMYYRKYNKKNFLIPLLIIWLFFFPNAIYIITDLFHLRVQANLPLWFDLVLILSFAIAGLLSGFISLRNMEFILNQFIKQKYMPFILTAVLFAGSFGVYIGRYLRYNTWDIIHNPLCLFTEIADRIIHFTSHPRTWAFTFLFGLFINMVYFSLRVFSYKKEKEFEA